MFCSRNKKSNAVKFGFCNTAYRLQSPSCHAENRECCTAPTATKKTSIILQHAIETPGARKRSKHWWCVVHSVACVDIFFWRGLVQPNMLKSTSVGVVIRKPVWNTMKHITRHAKMTCAVPWMCDFDRDQGMSRNAARSCTGRHRALAALETETLSAG